MLAKDIENILQEGIHGPKEINPEERKKFLGTLRERILAVLTKPQVRASGINGQIEELMIQNPKVKMILNGDIDYSYLRKYIKLANTHHIPFTISNDQEHPTDIGLVLAYDYAIDKENIYIQ